MAGYCRRSIDEAAACFSAEDENGRPVQPLPQFASAIGAVADALKPVQRALTKDVSLAEVQKELADAQAAFLADVEGFQKALAAEQAGWQTQKTDNGELKAAVQRLAPLAEASRSLVRQTDLLYKLASRLAEGGGLEGSRNGWGGKNSRALKAADEARQRAAAQLKKVRYFWKQAAWLTERFPEARLRDVEGLVKVVPVGEIAGNDWSLTPGRYVGVSPEEVDEDFDFEEALREIHVEIEDLNAEAVRLAADIKRNFEELGI